MFILHITSFKLSCKGYPSPTESHLWFVGKIFVILKCNNLNSFFLWSHIFQISKDWICDKIYCWKNNFIIWWAWYWIYIKNGSVEEFRIISFFWRESRLCLWECKGTFWKIKLFSSDEIVYYKFSSNLFPLYEKEKNFSRDSWHHRFFDFGIIIESQFLK